MNVNGVAISLVNEKRLLFLPLWFIPVCTNGERTIRGNDSIQAFFLWWHLCETQQSALTEAPLISQ